MFNKLIKLFVILSLFYQTPVYSKSASFNEFNSRDLSNYFSGIIAFENKDNSDALKFFNASKVLLNKHDAYLKRYSFSLVLENKVAQAINVIKNSSNNENLDLVYIDGTYDKKSTIENFNSLLKYAHNESVFIFNNIYWSKEMTEAWNIIKKQKEITVSIDTYYLGFLFFRKEQPKQHFTIRL